MTDSRFPDRVARDATDCAKAASELAEVLRGVNPAAERLAEHVCGVLISLAYDALEETRPKEAGLLKLRAEIIGDGDDEGGP